MSNVVFEQEQLIRCPECDEVFSFGVKLTEAQMEEELFINLDCPECSAELIVDFEQYLVAETTLYKSSSGSTSGNGLTLDLPEEMLASKRS